MSFSSTPLGQGRRLDHHTFLNNKAPNPRAPNSPPRADRIPTSYAYGAPTLTTRSPPKHPARDPREENAEDSQDDPALVRFARLKQREQALRATDSAPRTLPDPPNPTKWAVKDTSVQIASAFNQAAATSTSQEMNPNDSWASSSRTYVPRSTSVEYEKETQTTATRRLAPPPNRFAPPARSTGAARHGLVRNHSTQYVPDSEEENATQPNGGKTTFDAVVDFAKRTAFYLRQPSQEPEGAEAPAANGHTNGHSNGAIDPSYDYSAEEREFQAQQSQNQNGASRKPNATHRRNRMSTDNKAYRPPQSDVDESDEYLSEDGKKGRKKKSKKKDTTGGPLTTLPVTQYDKRRKRRTSGKGDGAGAEEGEGEGEGEESEGDEQSQERASVSRVSLPPPSRASIARGSVPPAPPSHYDQPINDASLESAEQGLDSIEEVEERHDYQKSSDEYEYEYEPAPSRAAMSIGGALGRLVHFGFRSVGSIVAFFFRVLALITGLAGRILGITFNVLFNQPARWLSRGHLGPWLKYALVAFVLYATWTSLRGVDFSNFIPSLPSLSSSQPYQAPETPPVDISALSARLMELEKQLHDISVRAAQTQHSDSEARSHLSSQIRRLESEVKTDRSRMSEIEVKHRESAGRDIKAVHVEMQQLRHQLKESQDSQTGRAANDEEARAKLLALEERVGSVEGGVREALELGKTTAKVGGVAAGSGAAWWSKLAKAVTIKSADGQDVTALIGHLVDSAVARYSRDTIAKPDFALNSGGAGVIPSLTSPTLEVRPHDLRSSLLGMVTGNGYSIGRPPITALHHETRNGHCWPFVGSQGQLGVKLAHPARIEEVTIDHVAKDVAWDMRSAPREMELWGLVEGAENLEKIRVWREERQRRKEAARREAEENGLVIVSEEAEAYPATLPRDAPYVKVAEFAYDIEAEANVQTFAALEEVRALGVDFGVVVLVVKSNWGREFTCLYRLRVHGQRIEQAPVPAAASPEAGEGEGEGAGAASE